MFDNSNAPVRFQTTRQTDERRGWRVQLLRQQEVKLVDESAPDSRSIWLKGGIIEVLTTIRSIPLTNRGYSGKNSRLTRSKTRAPRGRDVSASTYYRVIYWVEKPTLTPMSRRIKSTHSYER